MIQYLQLWASLRKNALQKNALREDERGVTAVEYGIIAALIATVLVIAVGAVGTGLSTAFSNIATHLKTGV